MQKKHIFLMMYSILVFEDNIFGDISELVFVLFFSALKGLLNKFPCIIEIYF